jgi:hypothetical protein
VLDRFRGDLGDRLRAVVPEFAERRRHELRSGDAEHEHTRPEQGGKPQQVLHVLEALHPSLPVCANLAEQPGGQREESRFWPELREFRGDAVGRGARSPGFRQPRIVDPHI